MKKIFKFLLHPITTAFLFMFISILLYTEWICLIFLESNILLAIIMLVFGSIGYWSNILLRDLIYKSKQL